MKKFFRIKVPAYLTVEASFLMPMALIICSLIIILSFYLYNQCVVYQDCYIAALRGSQIMDSTDSEVYSETIKQAKKLLENQIYQYSNNPVVKVKLSKIEVSANSGVTIPFYTYSFYENNRMDINKAASCIRMDPTQIIRLRY